MVWTCTVYLVLCQICHRLCDSRIPGTRVRGRPRKTWSKCMKNDISVSCLMLTRKTETCREPVCDIAWCYQPHWDRNEGYIYMKDAFKLPVFYKLSSPCKKWPKTDWTYFNSDSWENGALLMTTELQTSQCRFIIIPVGVRVFRIFPDFRIFDGIENPEIWTRHESFQFFNWFPLFFFCLQNAPKCPKWVFSFPNFSGGTPCKTFSVFFSSQSTPMSAEHIVLNFHILNKKLWKLFHDHKFQDFLLLCLHVMAWHWVDNKPFFKPMLT